MGMAGFGENRQPVCFADFGWLVLQQPVF